MNVDIVRQRIAFALLVVLVALVASFTTLDNSFAQDDIPLVVEDIRARNPLLWVSYLHEAYWPDKYLAFLYRPLTSLLIGFEYWQGGGTPIVFKVVQLTLYSASCIAVFALALRLIAPWAALSISLLFAAHPVHVEAVALAVNQAEVVVGLLAALAVAWYCDRRRQGSLSARDHAGLAAVTLIAAHFKESGIMIPGLLFALEITVLRAKSIRERLPELISLVVWQTLAVVITIALRSRIQFAEASGTFVAEAFVGLPIGARFLTMLSVVPEWLRLLLWPAYLAADYSPTRISPAFTVGGAQVTGLAILLLIGLLAWRLRQRTPVITLGILWCGLALFPVSNVLLPTGIALAERTLFLPSVGALLVVGGVIAEIPGLFLRHQRLVRRSLVLLVVLATALGVSRSQSRHQTWKSSFTIWAQTVIDVPTSYRAWVAVGQLLEIMGDRQRALYMFEQAVALWDNTSGPLWQLAEWHRMDGNCEGAVPLYRRTLELNEYARARASLIACLVFLGDYREARELSLVGMRVGKHFPVFRAWLRTADQAIRDQAPPGTVRFDPGVLGTAVEGPIELPELSID